MTPYEVVLIVGLPYMAAAMIWFYSLRDLEPIKSREWEMVLLSSFLGTLFFFFAAFVDIGNPDIVQPCALRFFPGIGNIPGFLGVRLFSRGTPFS